MLWIEVVRSAPRDRASSRHSRQHTNLTWRFLFEAEVVIETLRRTESLPSTLHSSRFRGNTALAFLRHFAARSAPYFNVTGMASRSSVRLLSRRLYLSQSQVLASRSSSCQKELLNRVHQARRSGMATVAHPVTQDSTSARGPTAMVLMNMGGPSKGDEVAGFLSRLFVSLLRYVELY